MDLAETLLALAGAVAPDGGRGVGRALRAILAAAAPSDAAEAVLRRPEGWACCRLDDGDADVAAADLLERVRALRAPLRLDDLPEAAAFPETQRRMAALGLRSLLAVPFAGPARPHLPAAGPEGAIVLARRYGWAFAGASLHVLWPVARLAGQAFELAIALTALTERAERLEAERARLAADPEAREAERRSIVLELEEARAAADRARAAAETAASRALDVEGVLGQTAAERDALREELSRSDRARAALDEELAAVHQELDALRAERDAAVESRERAAAVLRETEARLAEAEGPPPEGDAAPARRASRSSRSRRES